METSVKTSPILRRLALMTGVLSPALATAHGSDHLHFWGQHTAGGQGVLLFLSLLAVSGIGWWLWRSRGR